MEAAVCCCSIVWYFGLSGKVDFRLGKKGSDSEPVVYVKCVGVQGEPCGHCVTSPPHDPHLCKCGLIGLICCYKT